MIDKSNMKTTDWLTKDISPEELAKRKAKAIKQADKELARIKKKEQKQVMRAYRKMHRKHRRELVKHAKKTAEWDWCWLHDSVITQIRHMYEYYKAGNNVWQSDETLLPTIDELKHVLDLQEELEHLFDNIPVPEMTRNENGSLTFTYSDEVSAVRDRAYEREDGIYKEIYTYIGEHLRGWWD